MVGKIQEGSLRSVKKHGAPAEPQALTMAVPVVASYVLLLSPLHLLQGL